MKAVVNTKYGPPEVLQLKEVDKPVPKDNEVLIAIYATTVNSGDVRLRKPDPFLARLYFGLFKPRIKTLGVDLAGVIETIGENVTQFKIGDEVFGSSFNHGLAAHAQYKCLPEDSVLSIKPSNLSFEEAVSVYFGAQASLHFLRKAEIKQGSEVLIYGASGALGVYAVQLAKYFGAQVTAVCSTSNIEMVKTLGADAVFDYTKEDFSKSGIKYDIIFDTVGKSPFSGSIKSLKKKGYYLKAVHMSIGPIIKGLWTGLTTGKKVIGGVATENREDLIFLKELLEHEHISPIIDRTYPLQEIIEAHRYVEKGHKKGSVVIRVSHEDKKP